VEHDGEQRRAASSRRRAPTTRASLDARRALVGRKQDREHRVGHHERDLGGVVEAEREDQCGIERDLGTGASTRNERRSSAETVWLPAAAMPSRRRSPPQC